jgi:chaperone modulatory protein CbpM
MIATAVFLLRAGLDEVTLEAWIAAGWLVPGREGRSRFAEIDLARARLIRDLQGDLGVNDDGVAVALDLLDQVHGLRRLVSCLLASTCRLPEPSRGRLVADLIEAMRAAGLEPGGPEPGPGGRG